MLAPFLDLDIPLTEDPSLDPYEGPEDPRDWPDWTDDDRWVPTPPSFEPSEDDRNWAVENIDTDQDEAWFEYGRWAEWYEQKMTLRRMDDARYEADMYRRHGV
jgi:hypothetical protein